MIDRLVYLVNDNSVFGGRTRPFISCFAKDQSFLDTTSPHKYRATICKMSMHAVKFFVFNDIRLIDLIFYSFARTTLKNCIPTKFTCQDHQRKMEGEPWEFQSEDEVDESTIRQVQIEVFEGSTGFNQTPLKYKLGNRKNYSTSGVIENEANIWIHPPRDGLFKILELNPFPFVKFPLEKRAR